MRLDEFLVTAQFGSMITAHTAIESRSGIVVKSADCKVEHSVVAARARLLKDILVGIGLGYALHSARMNKHLVIEIALVDLPHIDEADNKESAHKDACAQSTSLA